METTDTSASDIVTSQCIVIAYCDLRDAEFGRARRHNALVWFKTNRGQKRAILKPFMKIDWVKGNKCLEW